MDLPSPEETDPRRQKLLLTAHQSLLHDEKSRGKRESMVSEGLTIDFNEKKGR